MCFFFNQTHAIQITTTEQQQFLLPDCHYIIANIAIYNHVV